MGIEYEDKLANDCGFLNPETVMEESKNTIKAGPFTSEEMKKLIRIFSTHPIEEGGGYETQE